MDAVLPTMSMNEVYVGGLVTAKGKKDPTFYGLPPEDLLQVNAPGDPEVFPTTSSQSSLTLSVALNAIFGWTVGGGLQHSNNANLTQITASSYTFKKNANGSATDGSQVLSDHRTQEALRNLILRRHLSVYQVQQVSTTRSITFTTSGSIGANVSVSGGTANTATATNCGQAGGSSANQPGTTPSRGAAGDNGTTAGKPAKAAAASMPANATTPAGTPGGSLQLCTTANNLFL